MCFYENACVFQSENVRWVHSVAQYREQESTLCGDVLLTAAFISYAGSFSKRYREELLHNLWMPYLRAQKVRVCDCETVYLEYWFSVIVSISKGYCGAKNVYCFTCSSSETSNSIDCKDLKHIYPLHSVVKTHILLQEFPSGGLQTSRVCGKFNEVNAELK